MNFSAVNNFIAVVYNFYWVNLSTSNFAVILYKHNICIKYACKCLNVRIAVALTQSKKWRESII